MKDTETQSLNKSQILQENSLELVNQEEFIETKAHPGSLGNVKSRKKSVIIPKLQLEIVEETENELQHQNLNLSSPAEFLKVVDDTESFQTISLNTAEISKARHVSKVKKRSKSISLQKMRSSVSQVKGLESASPKIEEKNEVEDSISENHENPRQFYLRKRRQSLGINLEGASLDLPPLNSQDILNTKIDEQVDFGSVSSIQSSIYASVESVLSKMESKEDINSAIPIKVEQSISSALASGALNQLLAALGFLKPENSFFDRIHDRSHRAQVLTPYEIYKYRTLNDIGIPYDAYTEMPIDDQDTIEFEKDPSRELERLNFLIKSSSAVIPSHFRRRGYILMRCGKYEEAISDFDKSISFGNFFEIIDIRSL